MLSDLCGGNSGNKYVCVGDVMSESKWVAKRVRRVGGSSEKDEFKKMRR